jgi:cytochrome P450
MMSFVLLMALNQEVQQRAYEEITCSVGEGETPRVEHLGQLQYLFAVMQEVLRFAPVANLGE